MTEQEKIREGLAVKLASFEGRDYWRMTEVDKEYWLTQAYGCLEYLHNNGGVIKVDRELPPMPRSWYGYGDVDSTYKASREDMLKWHNDSLEPLIKEDDPIDSELNWRRQVITNAQDGRGIISNANTLVTET